MITLQFFAHSEISTLAPEKRLRKILDAVKDEKIVLIEGRLSKHEEAELIKKTMESINGKFKGIELSVVAGEGKNKGFFGNIHNNLIELISGGRNGLTIIGPASVVKEIKKDPDKIQLLTFDQKKKRRR